MFYGFWRMIPTSPHLRRRPSIHQRNVEAEQASFNRPATRQGELEAIRLEMITALERLAAASLSAYRKNDIWLWTYKVEKLLQTLVAQFGEDASLKNLAEKYYPEMKNGDRCSSQISTNGVMS